MNKKKIDPDDLDSFSFKTIKQGSKSFALASKIFDPETERATVLLYLWCRYCDDAIDSGDKTSNKQKQLQRILQDVNLIYKKEEPSGAVDSMAFKKLIEQVDIQQHYPQELLAGMAMDLEQTQYSDIDELLLYCYRVAGVVGLMMCSIMRVTENAALPHACSLG
ncbi:MAG: squalene/phytoene synthase family protein, partial [Pseudobdellovibrio sp.]